jgi:hypothetical protein
MVTKIDFDEKLRERLGGAAGIEVEAATVHAALLKVAAAYPALHMFNCDGDLRGTLKVRRDGVLIPVTEALQDGSVIELGMG